MSNDHLRTTLDSIFEQSSISAEDIQIILAQGKDTDYSDYISELQSENKNITLCKGRYGSQAEAYTDALTLVKGKYVCFPECGGAYTEQTFAFMKATFEIRDISLAMIAANPVDNLGLTEARRSLRGKPNNCDLNDKFDFHLTYLSSFFISTALKFEINKKLNIKSVFECDMLMKLALQVQTIDIFKDIFFYPWNGNPPIFSFFEELRESKKELKLFFDEFVTANVEYCNKMYGFQRYVWYI